VPGPGVMGRHAGQVAAAARWIIQEDAGVWVFGSCKKADDDETAVWNMAKWTLWKEELSKVADGEYDQNARETSQQALDRMVDLEGDLRR
jgi:hypothetical protein